MNINPILLEVFKNRISSISEEMGVTLTRTAYSSNIKERRDHSCAIFDRHGEMIAQAAHIPVHLGSMPLSVKFAIDAVSFEPGDMVMLNDPYKGGTHLPDITLVAPVFFGENREPSFYVANRAHHSDVGGMSSGSMPLSSSIYQEGIIIPPTKLLCSGTLQRAVLDLILSNVRTPEEREGDFAAQIMANAIGVRRMRELIEKYGESEVARYAEALIQYSETITRKTIEAIPDGIYEFTDFMESDGLGATTIPICLTLEIHGNSAKLDFTQTANQVQGSINAVRSITLSAVLYVFRSLVSENIPTNSGCMRPLEVITRKGSLVDAAFPAAVAGGNVETSQRIVDVVLGALAQAVPDKIPAASQGTMNNVTIGGINPQTGKPFSYYETLGGGMGASAICDGESAVHSHMTNTMNTPIEALEYSYPFRVVRYEICKGTGGTGQKHGGDGLLREYEMLAPCEVTVLSERRTSAPYGLNGGNSGKSGENYLVRNGKKIEMPAKFQVRLQFGDRLVLQTPGGGGYGKK
ncbi:5-oxoprolinase (ATP-hydrolyzing) [Chloroherpeton thalassium ATCC 35110]|uniref:5-oxoprolinase (ATP-hydrolyzing) n=1 Tax=Chloroherpeton thalassium (strain ATCC 35110 / GB-78) TaxID=517418 RepID=B3QRP5_CHLT3|nr:hydantoinase B/oxoprolinase family protein [Chloroherpeton thalassium]ACF13848.1 5-oxoprolinase (ATP-hydrolyzing) [Chloroherpeton thalassium ATCC 35110]